MLYAKRLRSGMWMVYTNGGVYICSLGHEPTARELGRIARSLR